MFALLALTLGLSMPKGNQYPMVTTVISVNAESDIVICEDTSGNWWSLHGTEDWTEGDFCSMIMSDNGTEDIHDDIIVTVKYDGHNDNWVKWW